MATNKASTQQPVQERSFQIASAQPRSRARLHSSQQIWWSGGMPENFHSEKLSLGRWEWTSDQADPRPTALGSSALRIGLVEGEGAGAEISFLTAAAGRTIYRLDVPLSGGTREFYAWKDEASHGTEASSNQVAEIVTTIIELGQAFLNGTIEVLKNVASWATGNVRYISLADQWVPMAHVGRIQIDTRVNGTAYEGSSRNNEGVLTRIDSAYNVTVVTQAYSRFWRGRILWNQYIQDSNLRGGSARRRMWMERRRQLGPGRHLMDAYEGAYNPDAQSALYWFEWCDEVSPAWPYDQAPRDPRRRS